MTNIEKQLRQAAKQYVNQHSIKFLADEAGLGYQTVWGFVNRDAGLTLSGASAMCNTLGLELRRVK